MGNVEAVTYYFNFYQPRKEYDGRLCFYRCLLTGGGGTPRYLTPPPPPPGLTWGGGAPRYLPPARPDGGTPRYHPPRPRYLSFLARSNGGTTRYSTYTPQPGLTRGYPKVPTSQSRYLPLWPGLTGGRGYPTVPPPSPPGQDSILST